jgi:hypothetical protein
MKNTIYTVLLGKSPPTFRWNAPPPSSGLKSKPTKKLLACFLLVCLAYSSILKIEVISSSEISVRYRTTRRYIPEGPTLSLFYIVSETRVCSV